MKKTLKIPATLYRTGTSERGADGEMVLSISSNTPYKRHDWYNDEDYYEVLKHEPDAMDLSRLNNGAALLYNHDRDIQLGTITAPEFRDGKCYVKARLSKAEDVKSYITRIEENILKDTSVGYRITDEGVCTGAKDGCPVYEFRWAPHEASMVTIPADITVGVGRSREEEAKSEMREVSVEVKDGIDKTSEKPQTRDMPEATTPAPETKPTVTIDVNSERNQAIAGFKARCKKIDDFVTGLANHPDWQKNVATLANKHKEGEANWSEFHEEALRAFPQSKPVVTGDPSEGMKQRDISKYSILRAIQGVIGSTQGKRFDGLEREMSDEVGKKHDRASSSLGFFLPHDVMVGTSSRTLFSTGSFTAAGALVPVGAQGQSLIDLYRNKMHVVAMGARVLGGLQGTLAIPRQTGGATASWLAEDATITASNQAVGQLTLTPHRLAAATAFTTQLLAQASPDAESFVREDLMTVLAVEKDRAALLGTGAAGEPLGIYNTPNIATTVNITGTASITYAEIVDFETNVAAGNADQGSLGYITSVFIRGNARVTPKFTNTGTPIWEGDMCGNYPGRATNQLTATPSVIFGNWNDLIIGDWVSPEIIVDPYSLSMANQIRIVVHQLTDIGIRHPKSFCFGVV